MHRTTLNLPEELLRRTKVKAVREELSLSEAVRRLLDRWVAGEIGLDSASPNRERLTELAQQSQGMWADRDPDELMRQSRAGLARRDEELESARLAPR